ncbi:MAG: ATP-binding cassette domain-containing protein [Myxococcota bacterium]|nr:ATP-binding cassette domain-containing protein [Myxococcota bacterium]
MIELQSLHLGPLRNLNMALPEGSLYAMFGPTNSGKSLLLRCLAGLQPPDAGVVAVHGRRLYGSDHRVDAAHRDEVGMVFDTHASIPDRSVLENVRLPLDLRGIDQEEGDARALALLEELGIADAASKRPGELSGGMLTRLQLARSLIHDPRFLVFDGPTAGLDPVTASRSLRLIARLLEARQATGVVTTHDVRSALPYVEGVILISGGLARGPLPAVLAGDVLDFCEGHRPW